MILVRLKRCGYRKSRRSHHKPVVGLGGVDPAAIQFRDRPSESITLLVPHKTDPRHLGNTGREGGHNRQGRGRVGNFSEVDIHTVQRPPGDFDAVIVDLDFRAHLGENISKSNIALY